MRLNIINLYFIYTAPLWNKFLKRGISMKLKEIIKMNNVCVSNLADMLNISLSEMIEKINNPLLFEVKEVNFLIELLDIKNPIVVFLNNYRGAW